MAQVVGVMQWWDDPSGVLDWIGRDSPHHMPRGTRLKQIHSGERAGDFDPNATAHLMVQTGKGEKEARINDWVCKLSNGNLDVLPESAITLVKNEDGSAAFVLNA